MTPLHVVSPRKNLVHQQRPRSTATLCGFFFLTTYPHTYATNWKFTDGPVTCGHCLHTLARGVTTEGGANDIPRGMT